MSTTATKKSSRQAILPILLEATSASAAPKLKPLGARVKITEPDPKVASDIPVLEVEGNIMRRFNLASAAKAAAEEVIKDLRPDICQIAKQHIFEHNCKPGCVDPLTSVKLQDVEINKAIKEGQEGHKKRGEVTRVSFTSAYNSNDPAKVETAFEGMRGRDLNDYVALTLKASFDSDIFLDADGNFNQKVYDKFRIAIEGAARELGLKNTDGTLNSPLKTQRVLSVKDTFHTARFKDFDVDENFDLSAVLPNTIQCVPVRTV